MDSNSRLEKKMTEKEFLERLLSTSQNPMLPPGYETQEVLNTAKRAVELARQAGARFDTCPIELPKLTIRTYSFGEKRVELHQARKISNDLLTTLLSEEQAKEVIRRCELIPRLREYLKKRFLFERGEALDVRPCNVSPPNALEILALLDGN